MRGYTTVCICCLARFNEAISKYSNLYGEGNVTSMLCKTGDYRVFVKEQANPKKELEMMRATRTYIVGKEDAPIYAVARNRNKKVSHPAKPLMKKYQDIDMQTLEQYSNSPEIYTIVCDSEKKQYAKIVKVAYKWNRRSRNRHNHCISSTLAWLSDGTIVEINSEAKVGEYVQIGRQFKVGINLKVLFADSKIVEVNKTFFGFCDEVYPLSTFKEHLVKHVKGFFPENDEISRKILVATLKGEVYDLTACSIKEVLLSPHKSAYKYFSGAIEIFFDAIAEWIEARTIDLAKGNWETMEELDIKMTSIAKNYLAFKAMENK